MQPLIQMTNAQSTYRHTLASFKCAWPHVTPRVTQTLSSFTFTFTKKKKKKKKKEIKHISCVHSVCNCHCVPWQQCQYWTTAKDGLSAGLFDVLLPSVNSTKGSSAIIIMMKTCTCIYHVSYTLLKN